GFSVLPFFLLFGPLGYILFRRATRKRVLGLLPMTQRQRVPFLITRWLCTFLLLTALVMWTSVIAFRDADPGVLGLLALAGLSCLLLLILISQTAGRVFGVGGRVLPGDLPEACLVELDGIHPQFQSAFQADGAGLMRGSV